MDRCQYQLAAEAEMKMTMDALSWKSKEMQTAKWQMTNDKWRTRGERKRLKLEAVIYNWQILRRVFRSVDRRGRLSCRCRVSRWRVVVLV